MELTRDLLSRRLVARTTYGGVDRYYTMDEELAYRITEAQRRADLLRLRYGDQPYYWKEDTSMGRCTSCGKNHGSSFFDHMGRCEVTRDKRWSKLHKLFFERK